MLYLRLFHGRRDPAQEMDDWGEDGPIGGPYRFVHTTYGAHVTMGLDNGELHDLYTVEDMVHYDDVYYGDWSVFTEASPNEGQFSTQPYDVLKAELPKKPDLAKSTSGPVKIIVYVTGGICQDVITNLSDDSWEYVVVDHDNEPHLPGDHVPCSKAEMKVLPSVPKLLELVAAASSVVKNWDGGDLAGSVRQMVAILERIEHS